ncbi:MAG: hypothetical protein MUC49_05030 [Raineya sp.]|jgi:hypothetical protein|nr:hypothetical protein [Raineya sp.]
MEKLYNGRVKLNENIYGLEIIIPTKKNWFFIIFNGAWLVGWVVGEMIGITFLTLTIFIRELSFILSILFWLCLWTLIGFFTLKLLLWNAIGKEIITFRKESFMIRKKGLLFSKPKNYDTHEVKNIKIQEEESTSNKFLLSRNLAFYHTNGTIRFNYGSQNVKFGDGIDESEAHFILEKLKAKKILTDENF